MKVLHIFGCLERGGAQMRTIELMPLMKEKGVNFDFCVLSDNEGDLEDNVTAMGAKIHRCFLKSNVITFGQRFKKILREEKYDAVHSHVFLFSGKILQLAHQTAVPKRIVHFRTINDGKAVTMFRRFYHAYMRYLLNRHSTDILSVCNAAMEYGWSDNWQNDERCKVIYNGINLKAFEKSISVREELCRELRIDSMSKLLINVGSFYPAKAHDILINAVKEVCQKNPSVHLLLVGIGELLEQIQGEVEALGLQQNVHFLGARNDVPCLLKSADCFVLSSRREGLPGVVLEALAAGLPVVATDLPGVREIASYTDAVEIVKLENIDALAEGILKILEATRPATGDSLPKVFNLEKSADDLYKVYCR